MTVRVAEICIVLRIMWRLTRAFCILIISPHCADKKGSTLSADMCHNENSKIITFPTLYVLWISMPLNPVGFLSMRRFHNITNNISYTFIGVHKKKGLRIRNGIVTSLMMFCGQRGSSRITFNPNEALRVT